MIFTFDELIAAAFDSNVRDLLNRKSGLCCLRLLLIGFLLLTGIPFAQGQAQTVGQWSTLPYTMPINPVHAALLHTGKVLIVSGSGNFPSNTSYTAALWDPQTGSIVVQNVGWDMFCNGMVILPDGRPFIVGGTEAYDPFYGLPNSATYDPATGKFTNQQSMAHGRWYPTTTILGDGSVLAYSGAISGEDDPSQTLNGSTNSTVEIYTVGSGWSQEYAGLWTPPLYPRLHLLPNGTVFYSGPSSASAIFDPTSHAWTINVAATNYGGNRGYGTSVLLPLTPENNYDPRVMILGGGNPATNTTEIIDLGANTPAWQYSASMSQPRIEMNAVILPTGRILAVGGSVDDEDAASASLNADLFDPVTQQFSPAGVEAYPRLYHSVALLLPDASVWVAGSNPVRGTYEQHMEIYKPAYLFTTDANQQTVLAARPAITSAPSAIDYGTAFQVQTPDAANISSVVMMRNPAVTHAFDMDQRMVGLSFTAGSGTLAVTGPPNGNIAPPGYYMLFFVNNQGVPSMASMVQISSGTPPPPPPGIGYVQVKATTQTSGTSVAIAYPVAEVAGDLNVVEVMWGDTTASVSSVTDNKGNAYALAVGPTKGTGLTSSIYYAKNIAGGSTTVTVTFNRSAAYPNVNVLEYSGLDTANPLDVSAAATGSGTTANSGSATTRSASELIVGAGNPSSVFKSAGSGFSSRLINAYGGISEDKVVNSTGSYNATATLTSGSWVMQMAAFRGSGQGSSPPPAPTVSSITPSSGPASGGTPVTITGSGFQAGATVSLGGTAATGVSVSSSTTITATTAAHAAGTVNVVVTNPDSQSGTLPSGYSYGNPAPTVSSITPSSGPASGGTPVTITGSGFQAGATVSLGGTAATGVSVSSSTTITATTAAHAAGTVNVVVTNPDSQSGTLPSGYSYGNPAPTVSSITPSSGPASGGTPVTITGSGFQAGATVSLGGTAATGVSVSSSTTITATTAAHAAGTVNVVVTNPDSQSGTLPSGYSYGNPAPTVSSITPSSGPASGGTPVTITGSGFQAGATVSLGGTAATGVSVSSSTTITATTAAHAAGTVNVVVTNPDSQSGTLPSGYSYGNPAPTVSSITPSSGPASGGTPVTITGSGFQAGATVSLGGTAATGVSVSSSTTITATTTAHAAGTVNVVVTNPDSQSGILANGYTYNVATGGTIAYVQGKSVTQKSGTSVAIAYPAAEVAGDLNVVAVMWGDTTSSVSSVADSKGNVYALAGGPTKGTGLTSSIYYAKNIAGGSTTVTVTFNRSAAYPNVNVLEYSGLDTANPLDVSAAATGSGTTANSGSATTRSASELIVGAGNPSSVFKSAGSGFSSRLINAYGGISEDKVVNSTGSYNATAMLTSGSWVMQMATFRASGR